jgi:hypothetical protein
MKTRTLGKPIPQRRLLRHALDELQLGRRSVLVVACGRRSIASDAHRAVTLAAGERSAQCGNRDGPRALPRGKRTTVRGDKA